MSSFPALWNNTTSTPTMPAISITALADPVAIAHIPVHAAVAYETKLYWTINHAAVESGEFFNVTSNRVEIAIFASVDLITREWAQGVADPDVRVSTTWKVFEISSGEEDDSGNYDSPHLRYVSAPLARAGISILYQSSYFTDFLLVKEEDFDKAARIFVSQGWKVQDNEPSAPVPRRRSALFSPAPTSSSSTRASPSPPPTPIPTSPEITVLPSPLACVGFAKSAERACNERLRKYIVWPERSLSEWRDQALDLDLQVDAAHHDDHHRLSSGRPFISYTRTEDGASLVTEIKALRGMFPSGDMEELEVQCAGELSFDGPDFDQDEDDYEDDEELDYGKGDNGIAAGIQGISALTAELMEHGAAPPTPPLDHTSFTTASSSSAASSPEKKRLSLPLPVPLSDTGLGVGAKGDMHVPISWSRPMKTTRSMSASVRPLSLGAGAAAGGSDTGVKRCLQLDLRGVTDNEAYNLDKFGLVTLFSDLLDSAHIKMLYSSTFHTANVLVEAGDIGRARRLLKRGSV